ncbi:molecular chaperone [Psychrobacter sp. SCQQ22]|uniref:fimbrial biogenesis chaperone n=1 Tax=Psychrobacter sp. SCQQ22 TaxID=2792059 RepID=UPI0018CE8202|nr:molecular chaperone [Psychrobacter sp. SCQQ22]MBH0086006.1 molecular chaperone [Psychrobacter sp. SCQQ22]
MPSLWLRRVAKPAVISSLLLSCSGAMASGLQVSPISLSLQARENASGLTLSNSSDEVINAQVRVYQWSQDETGDQLAPSRGLLASPPMIELNPGDKQLVRIIRAKAPPQGMETSYRILVNELPIKSPKQKSGLQFAMSYSLPVFVQPIGIVETSPQLKWQYTLLPDGEQITLRVHNSGNGHAKLIGLSVVNDAGNNINIHQGLLGYILPDATMNWTLKVPPSGLIAGAIAGKFKVTINGTETIQDVTLDTSDR